jgi:hypothetical protein
MWLNCRGVKGQPLSYTDHIAYHTSQINLLTKQHELDVQSFINRNILNK